MGDPGSPPAPRAQNQKWSDPTAFDINAQPCEVSMNKARRRGVGGRPSATVDVARPRITYARHGQTTATIAYAMPARAHVPAHSSVRVVLHSAELRNPASSILRPTKKRRGVATLTLPAGKGPYRVEVRVFDRRNRFGPAAARTMP